MDHGSHVENYKCDGINWKTWLCNGQWQNWSIPCNGNCRDGHFLNCKNECEEKNDDEPPYMCGQECYESWRPCNGSCKFLSGWRKQKCYGQDACLTNKYLWKCPEEYRTTGSNVLSDFLENFEGAK